jgi:hypothetical protein
MTSIINGEGLFTVLVLDEESSAGLAYLLERVTLEGSDADEYALATVQDILNTLGVEVTV